MSFSFNIGYQQTALSSFGLNEKIDRIYGSNGVISGFDISSQGTSLKLLNLKEGTTDNLEFGEAIVNGTLVRYQLADGEAPVTITNLQDGTWYVYGLYSVYKKVFAIKLAPSLEEAKGTWKVFLGHIVVSGGTITEIQPLVPTSDTTKPVDYRRLTSLSTLARYVYDANSAVLEDIWKKVLIYVGDITFLKTVDKTTIVNAINELYVDITNITETIGDNLEIENFAKKRVEVNDDGINCFQMKQFNSTSAVTGYIMIKLPIIAFNNESMSLTVRGVSSASGKGFLLTASGVLSLSNSRWENCSAYVLGDIPCSEVTFARNSSDGIYIILGAQGLNWGQINISLENVLVTKNTSTNKNLWRDGWEIKTMTTAPTATSSTTSTIKTGGPQDGEFVDPSRQIKAGVGLEGGGNLRNDVTISAKFGTGYNEVARGNHTHGDTLPSSFDGKAYRVIVTDGTGRVVPSEITTSELDCLDGIRSNIQTQLDGKASASHSHSFGRVNTGVGLEGGGTIGNGDLTISAKFGSGYNDVARGNHTHGDTLPSSFDGKAYRVIVTDGAGKVVPSEITTSELNCLDGIRSNIQQQLDSKLSGNHTHPYLPLAGGTVTGNLTVNGTTRVEKFQIGNRQIIISKTRPSSATSGTILFQVNS